MDKCFVCDKKFNPFNPVTKPPTCGEECWQIWTTWQDHRGKPCWIKGCLEVFCGIETPGYCRECQVFKIEEEIKKRGLDKDKLFGNY